jgi:two-component system, NarL family, sensor histidine kinase EvgS
MNKHRLSASALLPLLPLLLMLAMFIGMGTQTAFAGGVLILTEATPRAVSLTPAEIAYIKANPKLRVATKPDWAPIDRWRNDGVYTGLSGDYLRLIASRLGMTIEATQYDNNNAAIAALKAGNADIIPSLALTPERQAMVNFSAPYLDVPNAVFARRDVPLFAMNDNWRGLRVAAEKGFAVVDNLRKLKPQAVVIEFADTESAMLAVSRGEADIYAGALPTSAATIERLLVANVEVRGYVDSPFRLLHFGVRRDEPLLVSAINRAIASISAVEADAIRERWMPARTLLSYADGALPMTSAQREWITKNDRIRVAFDPEMSPITFVDSEGKMSGLAVDYLKIVAKKLGLTIVEERRGTWTEILEAARRGEVDVLIAAAINQERLDFLDFAGPYLTAPSVLVDANKGFSATDLNAFVGKKLAVQRDHFLVAEISRRYPGITIMPFATMEEALAAVASGNSDGALGNLHPISQLIETKFIGKLRISGNVARGDSVLYFATPKAKPELGQLLTLAKSTISEAERNVIRDRWLRVTYQPGFSWKSIVNVGAPILAALLGALMVFVWLNRRLRLEMKRRNALVLELASKKMEAEAATQVKARFLAAMSHEIRTPMQGILGAADMLSRSGLEPPQARLNGIVRDAAQNLVQMLNEILDERKLEEGHMTARSDDTDIAEKVKGAVDVFAPSAMNKSLMLNLTISPQLEACYKTDGTYIRQIVSNLVSNAIKFTKKGSVTVSVEVRSPKEAQGASTTENAFHEIVIAIRDTGSGMSQAEVAALFQPFAQGSAGVASGSGSGLGLSICAKLAAALSGKISVDSHVGQGTTFTFSFPAEIVYKPLNDTNVAMKSIAAKSEHAPPAVNPTQRKLRALACEDDPLIQELMHDQFAELNIDADIVGDASIGLRRWRETEQAYDIVFTDNSMGGMSGIEFTRLLREDEMIKKMSPIPVVGITGSIMQGEIQKCLDAGMNRVLCKPVVLADLKHAIDELVPSS